MKRPSRVYRASRPYILICIVISCLVTTLHVVEGSLEGEVIGEWAETFGEELWDLGQRITKAPEIKARYKELNVRVERKDGPSLLKSAVETVGLMLSSKMDAIRCIQVEAESLAEEYEFNNTLTVNLTYYSAKYSVIEGEAEPPQVPETLVNNSWLFRNMSFNIDTHFYNIPVNTSYSSVHVPTNVYDRSPEILETIDWSESLDVVFAQNYKSDPALSWQYFGSSTGLMRQYPAIAWPRTDADVFDCRTRSWFIEAATCSKDIVILFDNSGSMAKYRNFIARVTVKQILGTLSNNDFLNIYSFSNETSETVDCFKDRLVQATPDNLRTFNEALEDLKPDNLANFTVAFTKAFEILENYRISRGCNGSIVGCNQVIMLITDGVPGNLTQVFDTYNNGENGTQPVRVFTYLIGKEVTNVREIQWMACLNRGYYVHIQSLDEVQEKVLKYIDVIARPLVLQEEDHPITWTHAYVDITHNSEISEEKNREEYRLMTSVAIPLYDKKINKMNDTRTAYLLGVAGTDVPVEDIDKLTLPYKLGVNGYSFIVSNNGYLLLHPDLRPVYDNNLKENYNSVDVVEVEMVDDDLGIRELGPKIRELRDSMVGDTEGSMLGVSVRFHYDNMRRVSREKQDYYFAPLPNTPFSLGIVLPSDYGNTWIKVGDEIKRNQHLGLKVEDFFVGDNWKIHPKWVYCKYHYLEGHEYDNPELELLDFLRKMGEPNWKWSEQYEPEPDAKTNQDGELNCGRKTQNDDDYYCNKELVQLLVFDAKVTFPSYNTNWTFIDKEEEELFLRYNASLRFAATMSGLTRWQFVFGEDESNTDSEFGDKHTEAVDETWYKSAVLQHQVEAESFVFSVNFDAGEMSPEDVIITASHAVFPRDGGLQAPAAVLGYEFSHHLLYDRFMEITSKMKCGDCMKTCESDEQDCYVIDSSGYVIISETFNDTGKFFGEVEGAVMEEMVNADIFQKVSVFDLQGVCYVNVLKSNAGNILTTPFNWAAMAIQWFGAQLGWLLIQANLSFLWAPLGVWTQEIDDDDEYYDGYDTPGETPKGTPPPFKMRKNFNLEEEEYFSRPRPPVWEKKSYPCDRQADLFVLQQQKFIQSDGFYASPVPTNCSRPYYVKRIPYSNLIMVVVNTMYPSCYRKITAAARPVGEVPAGPPCHKLDLASLTRRRLEGCYTEHPLEVEIRECGHGSTVYISIYLLTICWTLHLFKRYIL